MLLLVKVANGVVLGKNLLDEILRSMVELVDAEYRVLEDRVQRLEGEAMAGLNIKRGPGNTKDSGLQIGSRQQSSDLSRKW